LGFNNRLEPVRIGQLRLEPELNGGKKTELKKNRTIFLNKGGTIMNFFTKLFKSQNSKITDTPENEPANDHQLFINKLKQIEMGMTSKKLKSLFGEPQFVMDSSAAFAMFGGEIPGSMKNRENWEYNLKHGKFGVAVKKGKIVDITGVQSIINAPAKDN
jgi:hypothetical protein